MGIEGKLAELADPKLGGLGNTGGGEPWALPLLLLLTVEFTRLKDGYKPPPPTEGGLFWRIAGTGGGALLFVTAASVEEEPFWKEEEDESGNSQGS